MRAALRALGAAIMRGMATDNGWAWPLLWAGYPYPPLWAASIDPAAYSAYRNAASLGTSARRTAPMICVCGAIRPSVAASHRMW